MPVLCLPLPRPGPQLRAVIMICVAAFRPAPGEATPLATGAVLGGQRAIGTARPRRAAGTRERAR